MIDFLERFHASAFPEDLSNRAIDRAMMSDNPDDRMVAVASKFAKVHHLDKALDDPEEYVRREVIRNTNSTADHVSKAMSDKSWTVRLAVGSHALATKSHIDALINDPNWFVRKQIKHTSKYKEYYPNEHE